MNNTYTVCAGDTLQLIAQKTLNDASRAMEIALLNELTYPFIGQIGDSPVDGVKLPGDEMMIPTDDEDSNNSLLLQSDPYVGTQDSDILLLSDYTEMSSYAGGEFYQDAYGDLQTVSGINSLKQDLTHRLMTEPGTLVYHPEYGSTLLQIIGEKKGMDWKQKAMIELEKTIRCDPRVINVSNIIVNEISTGVYMECDIQVSTTEFSFGFTG